MSTPLAINAFDTPIRLGDVAGTVVADVPSPNSLKGADDVHYYGGHLVGESISPENARRLIACWNACIGISTEDLEAKAAKILPPSESDLQQPAPSADHVASVTAALLDARDRHLRAQSAVVLAQSEYVEAENKYLNEWKAGDPPVPVTPPNSLAGEILIMPKEDWFDCRDGERLSFHTVHVVFANKGASR